MQMVAGLPPLPGRVLQAWCTFLRGADADADAANAAIYMLGRLLQTGDEQARRVLSAPGLTQVRLGLCTLPSRPARG